jgi:RHS repeat-associated protein
MLALIPASAASATPSASQASEVYVAVASPPELEVIDSTSGAEVGSAVSLAHTPTAVAEFTTSGSASSQAVVAEDNALQEVNPRTETASSAISLSAAPSAIAVGDVSTTEQYALVLEPSVDKVAVVNLKQFAVLGTVSLGFSSGSPTGIAFNADGEYAYVTDSSSHQVVTLQYISTSPHFDVEATYTGSSGFDPTSIVDDAPYNAIVVSDGQNVDESSASTEPFSAPYSQIAIACTTGVTAGSLTLSTPGTVFVQEIGSDYVGTVSLAGQTLSNCLLASFAPGALALTQDGGTLGVTASSGSTLDLYQAWGTSVGTLENAVTLDGTPAALASATNLKLDLVAYVAERPKNEVAMVDLTSGLDDQQVVVGSQPDAVAVSPDGQFAYVANYGDSTVSVIQTNLMDTTSSPNISTVTLPSGAEPEALAVSPNGDQLLVVDAGTGGVSVIDTNPADTSSYLTVTSTLCTNGGTSPCSNSMAPGAIAFSPDGSRAYVTDGGDGDLTILDQSSGTYSFQANQTSLFSGVPEGIAISPNDQTAYVTDSPSSGNGSLRSLPIDPANGQLQSGSSVTVAQGPFGVSLSPGGGTAYVLNNTSDSISVVNNSTGSTSTVSISNAHNAVGVTPDGSDFVATIGGSSSAVDIFNAQTNALVTTVSLGTSFGPVAMAVASLYNNPSGGSLAGFENDLNPSVAASANVDVVDGVNTATGGYSFNQADLSLPDIGLPVDFSQEHDSSNSSTNSEGLGYGWSFSYGMTLSQVSASGGASACDITVTQANGTPVVFYPPTWSGSCPTSGYEPASFEQATLSTVSSCYGGDSCWDMTRGGTTQFLFDQATGELVFEKDANANTVTLAYSSGKLSTVTGQSGTRSLSFSWTGSNITSVTDSAGRTASFGYTSGNLTSLTLAASSTGDPTSHAWAFSYNSSHRLTDWWSPDNEAAYSGNTAEATQVAYDSAGQVTSVIAPDWLTSCTGGSGACAPTTSFSYPSFDTTTDTGTVVISDPNENYDTSASLNDGNGEVTLDHYADGVLMSQARGYGYLTDTSSPYTHYPANSAVTSSIPDPFTWLPAESFDADGNLTTTSYDASGNVLSASDPLGNTTSYVYDRFNHVLQKTDPMSYVTSHTYDSHGNELTKTDADGNVTTFAYNSNGERCALLSGDGHAAGDSLTSCPSGSAPYLTAYGYDSAGDQTSVTAYDGTGNTVSATYVTSRLFNSAGEKCASLSADGYAAGDRIPSSCPTSGAAYERVNTAFDVFANVLSSISPTNASGGTTTTTYDADGNKLTTTDPASDVTTSTYGPDDQLCWTEPLSVSSPTCASPPTGTSTQTTTYSYDPDGNQISSVAPDGNVTTTLACLYTTSSTFDNLGNTLSRTTPTGGTTCSNETTSTTTNAYDANGHQLTSVVSPPPPGQSSDVTTTSAYDADGELCWSDVAAVSSPSCSSPPTGAGTFTTSYSYNADGQQTQVTPPDGNASGNPSNFATTNTYDGNGKVVTETAPPPTGTGAGETTTHYFDADGTDVAVTDPNGNPATCNPLTTSGCAGTTYNVYDEQNRQLSTTDPSGNETQYSYDSDGSLATITQPDSSHGTYSYNGAGQLIEISYSDGTPTVSYQYGTNGKRCWMYQGGASTAACSSPPTGATTYSYSSGRLTSETNSAGATDTYGYDAGSNLACVSYPNSSGNTCSSSGTPTGVVRYTYNQSNQLTSLTDWAGDTLTFTYNTSGEACWVSTYAPSTPSCGSPPHTSGSVTTAYGYDPAGNVSDLKTTTGTTPASLLDLAVGSRTGDFITAETPTVGSTAMATDDYGYNQASQVSSGPITGSSGATSYAYTKKGSITADTTGFQSAAYTGSGAPCWTYVGTSSNGCSSPPTGATTYSTNSDGERTGMTPSSGNPASYGWETDSGRLICANTNGTTCSTSSPTSTTTVYTYDGDGLRTSATIGSTTTNFTWRSMNGSPNLLSDGTWDYVYVNGSATPIEQIATTGSSPVTDLLLSDESANVRGLVQLSSGTHQDQLVNYTDYDAYGNPITEPGGTAETGGLTRPQTGVNSNYVSSTPWGFGEGYTDPSGLIYLVHRYYDPATGQFLSIDPDLSLTGEPYEYAGDNPITYSDSNGDSDQTCTTPFSNPYNLCFTVNSGSKGGQYVVYMAIQFNYINGPDGGCADPGPNRCNPPIYGNLTIHYGGGSGEGITYPAVSLNQARCRWP